jgi:hypothetical protein
MQMISQMINFNGVLVEQSDKAFISIIWMEFIQRNMHVFQKLYYKKYYFCLLILKLVIYKILWYYYHDQQLMSVKALPLRRT